MDDYVVDEFALYIIRDPASLGFECSGSLIQMVCGQLSEEDIFTVIENFNSSGTYYSIGFGDVVYKLEEEVGGLRN